MQLKCNPSNTRPSLQHTIVHLVNELLATHRCRAQLEPEPAPPEPVPPELLPRLSRARSEPKTWDVRDFRRQEQTWRACADVPIDAGNVGDECDARQRRVGLNHPRTGVLASLRYHAAGSAARVADLIVGAVSAFGVGERVLGRLEALVPERAASGDDTAETALYIVSRAREALSELKEYQTEAQRGEYYAALCVLSPEAVVERETGGMGRRVIVEPGRDSVAGSMTIPKGAYFAKVFSAAAALGEGGIYTVEKPNGERVKVQRHLLRHRSIKTIAYGYITDDKLHDGAAS
ncbi:hypothetical protein T492DRAFT_995120 [Pavlovales sp. CCMP2436]|nr:hypothetical protein T492DRAFT_995120 [Pavlovales sp. CCMP2436]